MPRGVSPYWFNQSLSRGLLAGRLPLGLVELKIIAFEQIPLDQQPAPGDSESCATRPTGSQSAGPPRNRRFASKWPEKRRSRR
jgi:hypothetical protein